MNSCWVWGKMHAIKPNFTTKSGLAIITMLVMSVGAQGQDGSSESGDRTPITPGKPYGQVTFAKGEHPRIVIESTMGKMVIELWPEVALQHCQNMVFLATKRFYNSLTFHRVVAGFVAQGGDPLGNGTGGPGYSVPAEFSDKPHVFGTLSMARSEDPNSAGSQFFLCFGRLTSLDGKYTVFGQLVAGDDVLRAMRKVKTRDDRPIEPIRMNRVYVEGAPQIDETKQRKKDSSGVKPAVAVARLESESLARGDVAIVSSLLREALWKTDKFEVLERDQVDRVIGELGLQTSGCTETKCAAEIGRALNVKEMIVGSLEKLGDMYIISIRFVNVESVKVTLAESVQCKCSIEGLPSAVNELANKIVSDME